PGPGTLVEHQSRRLDQVLVALRIVQPRDRADHDVVRRRAPGRTCGRPLVRTPRAAELLEWRAQVDDLHARWANLPGTDDERGGAFGHGERDVGVRLEDPIGNLLEPGRIGEVRVL